MDAALELTCCECLIKIVVDRLRIRAIVRVYANKEHRYVHSSSYVRGRSDWCDRDGSALGTALGHPAGHVAQSHPAFRGLMYHKLGNFHDNSSLF